MVVKNFSFKVFLSVVLLLALGLEASQAQQITLAAPPPSLEQVRERTFDADRFDPDRWAGQPVTTRDCCREWASCCAALRAECCTKDCPEHFAQGCARTPDTVIDMCGRSMCFLCDGYLHSRQSPQQTACTSCGLCCFCTSLFCCYVPCKLLKACSLLSLCCLQIRCCANNTKKEKSIEKKRV